jgi:hypothetical protein
MRRMRRMYRMRMRVRVRVHRKRGLAKVGEARGVASYTDGQRHFLRALAVGH